MNLTDMILSKGSQTQKIIYGWFSFTWNFQMVNTNAWLKFRTVVATWQKLRETNRKWNFLEWQKHSVSWERGIHLSKLIELYIIQLVYFNTYKIYLQRYKQTTKRNCTPSLDGFTREYFQTYKEIAIILNKLRKLIICE